MPSHIRTYAQSKSAASCNTAFTLIELLVVMAIIAVLVGLLLPALSKARDHAKSVKSMADLKTIGEALEAYRNENESDRTGKESNGYPPSAEADDPAVTGTDKICGAHWLVRHLMGKDLLGYAPRRNVPADLLNPGGQDEEVQWYEYNADGSPKVDRVGPYIPSGTLKILPTKELAQGAGNPALIKNYAQPVFVDAFGFPVLYYVANPTQAAKTIPCLASFDGSNPGIFTFKDNGRFTGLCTGTPTGGGSCMYPGWDFGAGPQHKIEYFGPDNPPKPETVANSAQTFVYYILNKALYDATKNPTTPGAKPTAVPYRSDSFLLFSPGRDAIWGSQDDVRNF